MSLPNNFSDQVYWLVLFMVNYRPNLLKVSRSQNKIVEPQILPKTNGWICFSILNSSQDRKTNLFVCFLGESVAQQFCFEIYWPLKAYEFNGDALSDAVAQFFHSFVIVFLIEFEKIGQPRLTEHCIKVHMPLVHLILPVHIFFIVALVIIRKK